jgi:hypothetical protein
MAKLGRAETMTLDQARNKAQSYLGKAETTKIHSNCSMQLRAACTWNNSSRPTSAEGCLHPQ